MSNWTFKIIASLKLLTSRFFPFLIALILALCILPVLGLPRIAGSSEARESHVAYIIKESREWVLPDRNGFVPSKPLLHHWLAAAASYLGNDTVDEFYSRLPSAVAGIIVITALFIFSRRLFLLRTSCFAKSSNLAFASILILTTTYGYFSMMLLSMVDMTFSCFVVLAVFSFLLPVFEQSLQAKTAIKISHQTWLLFFLFCALATLTKGPLGLLLPVLIVGVTLTYLMGIKNAFSLAFKPNAGWLLYACLSVPWYYLASQKSSAAFVDRQIFFENLKRFIGGDNINSEPFWFYVPGFIAKAAPWSLLLLLLFFGGVRTKTLRFKRSNIGLSLFSGIAAAILFFSISSGKRNSYLLPLYPLFSFAGMWIYLDWFESANQKVRQKVAFILKIVFEKLAAISMLLVLIALCLILFTAADSRELMLIKEFLTSHGVRILIAPILAACFWLSLRFGKLSEDLRATANYFLITALLSSVLIASTAIKAQFRDYPSMASTIRQQSGSREIVALRTRFDELLDPVFFYLGSPVVTKTPEKLNSLCSGDRLFITRRSNLRELESGIKIVEEKVLYEKAGKPRSIEERAISLFSCLS